MLFPEEMIISEIFLLKAECKQAFCHVFGRPIRYNNHDSAEFLKNIAEMKGVIIMKKIISIILTAALLVSLVTAAYAESAVGYTPTDVMEWYLADQDNAADIYDQAANAASRVVENLAYVASLNANDEQLAILTDALNGVDELRGNMDVDSKQRLGVYCAYIMRTLRVLCDESDPTGVYADTVQNIIDEFNAYDENVDTADLQTVYALFASVKLATVVTEECCTSQDQIDQIEAGLAELDAENEAAANVFDQMVVGSKWLRKMLGAFAKLNNANCIDLVEQELEAREVIVAEMTDPMEITNQYLASSMYALGIFTGDYGLE